MVRNLVSLAVILLVGCQIAIADAPPNPGYEWARINLFVSTKDDLSSYRFFLECGGDVYEAMPVKDQRVEVKGCGGTPQFSSGTVYAVPKNAATSFPANPSREQMRAFSDDLYGKKISGAIELFQHHFRTQIRKGRKAGESEYILSKTADGVKAEAAPTPRSSETDDERLEQDRPSYPLMIGGGLLLTSLIVGGGLVIMRSKRKNVV